MTAQIEFQLKEVLCFLSIFTVCSLEAPTLCFYFCFPVSDRVVPLWVCWLDRGPEGEVVLPTVHGRHEEKRQPAQIEALPWSEEELRLGVLYGTLERKTRERRSNSFPGNHLQDLHRQSYKILNLNFMSCILIM